MSNTHPKSIQVSVKDALRIYSHFFFATKLLEISAVVLNFIAILVALGSVSHIIDGRTGNGIAGLVAALLLTPYGLPLITIMLLGQVQRFKCWIQDCVY